MKPAEARARHIEAQRRREVIGQEVFDYVEAGGATMRPVPRDMLPSDATLVEVRREVRKLIARCERAPRGARRSKAMDKLILAMGRLLFVERVLALDPLERAALSPARMVELSLVSPDDLRARLAAWTEGGEV